MNLKAILLVLIMIFVIGCSSEGDGMDGMDHGGDGDMAEMNHDADDDMAGMDHGDMDGDEMGMGGTGELDVSTEKMSEEGMFHVTVAPLAEPVEINEIHTWKLTVMDMDMQPVENATVTFSGGMPEHGHGFPTEPEIVAGDEAGTYLIEGVKMQMSGWWEMKLDIATDTTMDSATFNIVLP